MTLFSDKRRDSASSGSAPDNDGVVGVVCVHLYFSIRIVLLSFNAWIIEQHCQSEVQYPIRFFLEPDTFYYPTD